MPASAPTMFDLAFLGTPDQVADLLAGSGSQPDWVPQRTLLLLAGRHADIEPLRELFPARVLYLGPNIDNLKNVDVWCLLLESAYPGVQLKTTSAAPADAIPLHWRRMLAAPSVAERYGALAEVGRRLILSPPPPVVADSLRAAVDAIGAWETVFHQIFLVPNEIELDAVPGGLATDYSSLAVGVDASRWVHVQELLVRLDARRTRSAADRLRSMSVLLHYRSALQTALHREALAYLAAWRSLETYAMGVAAGRGVLRVSGTRLSWDSASFFFRRTEPVTAKLVLDEVRRVSGFGDGEHSLLDKYRTLRNECVETHGFVSPSLNATESLRSTVRRAILAFEGTPSTWDTQRTRLATVPRLEDALAKIVPDLLASA